MEEKLADEVLQEYVNSYGVKVRVDKGEGVLRGVKLIGLESRNGRSYRETALAQASSLYEEAKVNVNHPKEGPLAPRDYQDRLGVIRNVELRPSEGLYGDLIFNPKHVLAEQLVWDAEHNPRNVGFSHNVLARLSKHEGGSVVEEITRVQSVDLVADPAATQGLFEQTKLSSIDEHDVSVLPSWDSMTLEALRLHRPDLLEEIESSEIENLRSQLNVATDKASCLERRQRIAQLLSEQGLSVGAVDEKLRGKTKAQSSVVGQAFFETLVKTEDEGRLNELIAERAELARATGREHNRLVDWHGPQSRDQTSVLAVQPLEELGACDFAKALKTSRN